MTSQPNPFAPHWLIRDIVIGSHRSIVGPGGLLFVGDSLVEGFYWNRISSLPVLNAGYSGIWTEALEPRVPLLLKSAEPGIAVLLVGTNDAKKDCTESTLDGVTEYFETIIRHFEAAAVPVIVMTPPPIERAKRLTGFYSADAMASLRGRIVQIAEGRAAAIVDLHTAFGDGEGAAREGLTTDGVHLSAMAYRELHDVLEKTVASMAMRKGQS
ncbi:GDSL-type esterase/lipase family protein [Microvirga sp. CF3062]|uniref:SGNH/GDSL hydrolase family protein n=1 Tax=Microvirga sp. CF3062 TaxID=3110182 RepID=UPI002E7A727F|nr:GDSL-type esterase/lipase family protein [Microvirga sp. CF3062]MEE1655155.1 GDSL-type esterase/lipase family protein [Microvirga sp. CF3062]